MATRVQDSAPTASPGTQIFSQDAGGDAIFGPALGLFGGIGEEPLVEAMSTLPAAPSVAPVSPTAWALSLYRCMDITLAMICLLALWPVMACAALMILISSPGPIFYSQRRFGRQGMIFGCLKFRTMEVDAERRLAELLQSSPEISALWARDRKLRDDPRITYFGRFLRRYSVDELPQLFNVLRGEMSIVGPRPLATDEAHFYGDAFAAYCSLKPGITGPWQISGRNQISFLGRARLDCEYARTKCVRQDCRIILRTIPVVLRGTGF
jgi:exopolysaccharide production protein ExoY